MKAKTIKAIIRKKINAWAASIEDAPLRELVLKNTIVTGGSIASMLLQEAVNDYDIYFRRKEVALAVAQYYVGRFKPKNKEGIEVPIFVEDKDDRIRIVVKSAGIASEEGTATPYEYFEQVASDTAAGEYVNAILDDPGDIQDALDTTRQAVADDPDGKPPYRPVFLSTNAITLSGHVQIVLRFWGEPESIHENYDFVHCTCHWTAWNDTLTLPAPALECLLARELRYIGSKYPVCSMIRLRKFIKRNFTVNAGQMLKIALQISALDLTNFKTLEDQLTGVDAAYFLQIISALKEKDSSKVETAYLVEIIDRLF